MRTKLEPSLSLAPSLALLLLATATLAPAPRSEAATPDVRLIAASTTDPAIDDVNGVHHVAIYVPENRLGQLMLYLPGTTASPQQYSSLIERTAELGYHAIGLAYVNTLAVNALCAGMGATGCHEQVRREVLFGTDESALVEVDLDNGIMNRLDKLLAHLETIAPGEGWDLYRDGSGAVQWHRVVVSGHSQGAGHAAFISRLERVARAVLFSGTEPAPWTQAGDFETPAEDMFGFAHRLEPIYTPIQASWDNIGLPGSPISVDALEPPFLGSHQLFTLVETCLGDPGRNGFHHNCHCVEGWMPPPLPDGTPHFQYAWDHLFEPEAIGVPSLSSGGVTLVCTALALSGARLGRRSRRPRIGPQ